MSALFLLTLSLLIALLGWVNIALAFLVIGVIMLLVSRKSATVETWAWRFAFATAIACILVPLLSH